MASDPNALRVVIGGRNYENWLSVDLYSDIFTPADSFSFSSPIPSFTRPAPVARAGAQPTPFDDFREGKHCDIYIGDDRQMAGVIDVLRFDGDRSTSRMNVTGRDVAAYLVDCEAKTFKAKKGYTVKTLIEKLIDPSFGIRNVIFSNEDNRQLVRGKRDKKKAKAGSGFIFTNPPRNSSITIDPGQKIASILDTHTKRLGVTWWLTAQGDLFIGKPNYNQEASYKFVVAANDDTNVEKWSIEHALEGRFSDLQVNGQGNASTGDLFNTSSGKPRYKGVSQDPDLVERGIVRKTIIADSDVTSSSEAQHRADIEQGERRLKAVVINLTVPDFGQVNAKGSFVLYAIDTVATLRIDELGIDGTYYVTQRRFREDRGSRRTELTLHEKGVWLS
jgi:prophage tail gpP-like protein